MSFGKSNVLTIILIALVPIGIAGGFLIGWGVYNTSGSLNIEGSTTVYKITDTTASIFMDMHPGVVVTVAGTGSGTGIGTLTNGLCDIAMNSRPVKESENTTCFDQNGEYLRSYVIASDAIAIIVNDAANDAFAGLTLDEARAVFNGTWDDWSEVPGTHDLTGAIVVCVREQGSGTRDFFNDVVMGDEDQEAPGSTYATGAEEYSGNSGIYDRVAENDAAIGYVGLAYVEEGVESILIDGVEATKANSVAGLYPVVRNLFLTTIGYPTPNSLVWEFINWHLSPEGQFYADDVGYIAVGPTADLWNPEDR
jgi:phosphate transport system substrate-binding protein